MQGFIQHAREFLPILLQGAVVTVQVTVLSFLLSSVIGLVLALGKLSPVRAVSVCASTVINVIRGLPIIVQLFYIYFVLPLQCNDLDYVKATVTTKVTAKTLSAADSVDPASGTPRHRAGRTHKA